jgi:simple sugar transport system permease protein
MHTVSSVWLSLVFAMLAGLAVAGVQANMSHRLPADQFVVGLVLNVLVLGVVGFLTGEIEPESHVVHRIEIPFLSRIPLLGPALFDQPWVLYLVYPIVPFVWWLVYRTRWGLHVRAVGEDPNAADVSGLHVNKLRRQTIYLTGILSGLAGAYFLFARSGRFEDSLIGGRGYIAIAAVIFGGSRSRRSATSRSTRRFWRCLRTSSRSWRWPCSRPRFASRRRWHDRSYAG